MNGYMGNIDTDAGIGTILSHFSSEYIDHVIDDSLNMKFRPFDGPMPNMVDILERNFLSISNNAKDYQEKVSDVRIETYKEIIYKICNFYNLSFTGDFDSMTPEEIYGVCHIMYDIFISRIFSEGVSDLCTVGFACPFNKLTYICKFHLFADSVFIIHIRKYILSVCLNYSLFVVFCADLLKIFMNQRK